MIATAKPKKPEAAKVPVALRALLARVNRQLRKDEQTLFRCRADSTWHDDLGDFYIVDTRGNSIFAKHVDLTALAKEKGQLKDFEVLAD
jgi:hypothetical protein